MQALALTGRAARPIVRIVVNDVITTANAVKTSRQYLPGLGLLLLTARTAVGPAGVA